MLVKQFSLGGCFLEVASGRRLLGGDAFGRLLLGGDFLGGCFWEATLLGRDSSVRIGGLEPPRLSSPDPKSGAATNYAISAWEIFCKSTYFPFTFGRFHPFFLRGRFKWTSKNTDAKAFLGFNINIRMALPHFLNGFAYYSGDFPVPYKIKSLCQKSV